MSNPDLDLLINQIEHLNLGEKLLLMERIVVLTKQRLVDFEKQENDKEKLLETAIEMLETVAETPRLWMSSDGVPVDNFLHGVRAMCRWFDLYDDDKFLTANTKALAERDIIATALSPYSKLERKLQDPQKAASEMLLIEADTLRRLLNE